MTEREETICIDAIIRGAIAEDFGKNGDITSCAIFDEKTRGRAVIKSKDSGVLSGAYLLKPIFFALSPSLVVDRVLDDGSRLEPGSRICALNGPLRGILGGERIALNFLQRLSGIATSTAFCAGLISHTKTRLLDTRKTTPLLRLLEKRAVLHGGGFNHRFGLFDMVLIKDTHIKAAVGPAAAIAKARSFVSLSRTNTKIECEVQTWEEFLEAVKMAPNRIMLDNMNLSLLEKCVTYARGSSMSIELEASGNITPDTIARVAETGVDFISMGCLTHSVKALDIHLVIE
jgi:nicotinate-nucleotide pyrophosphorylase (carboxylating)